MELKKRLEKMWQSLYWTRQYHVVTKYTPQGYNKQGVYILDEWTDYGCIGHEYDGKLLTEDEYLKVENSYVQCAKEIMQKSGCSYLTIAHINKMGNRIRRLSKFRYKSRVYLNELDILLREALRDRIDCHMVNLNKKFGIFPGTDYYMEIRSPLDWDVLNEIVRSHGLYLDPCSDKYDYLRE